MEIQGTASLQRAVAVDPVAAQDAAPEPDRGDALLVVGDPRGEGRGPQLQRRERRRDIPGRLPATVVVVVGVIRPVSDIAQ
ncbi:hypothetical protein D3C83_51000 [compost metagenome]